MLHGNTAQVTLNQGISEEGNNSLKGDNKIKKVQTYLCPIIYTMHNIRRRIQFFEFGRKQN